MEMGVILRGNRLIYDSNGFILMSNNQGQLFRVNPDTLPPGYIQEHENENNNTEQPQEENATEEEIPISEEILENIPLLDTANSEFTYQRAAKVQEQNSHTVSKGTTRLCSVSSASVNQGTANDETQSQHNVPQSQGISRLGSVSSASVNQRAANDETQSQHNVPQSQGISRLGSDERAHWTRREILRLIHAYKDNRHIFTSNSIKNSAGWRRVSEAVETHSPKQCEAKFKYLKGLYTKKKDNSGNGSSGARAISFEYFEEFDEIFRDEPNIVPLNLASSSTHASEQYAGLDDNAATAANIAATAAAPPTATAAAAIDEVIAVAGERATAPATAPATAAATSATAAAASVAPTRQNKRRRTRLEVQMERFQKNMELREQARERRMERFLQAQEACTNKVCDMLQKFIDKM